MRFTLSILLFSLCSLCYSQSIQWNWAASVNGPSNEDEIDALASDSQVNAYISGKFEDTLFINNYNDTLVSLGMADIMLVKYDSIGNMLWYKHFGGSGEDNTFDADCDGDDNLIISGYFEDTIVFNDDTLISNGGLDAFFVKFDPLGNIIWINSYGGIGDEGANEVSISSNNQIISCIDSDGDFLLGTFNVMNSGNRDAYLISISSSGNIDWYRAIEGNGGVRSKSIAVDLSGNIFFGGDFFGVNNVMDESGVPHLLNYVGDKDAFLTRWNANGDFKWRKSWGGTGFEYCKGLATNQYGEIYACGPFENTVSFNGASLTSAGAIDFFLWKMDSLGNSLWLKQLSSPSEVLEGGELISDGSDGVAFGMGMADTLTVDDLSGVQIFIPPTANSYPIFFQYSKEGQLVNSLECSYSFYGTTGEISRSGDYIYLDIIYAGGVALGSHTITSSPFNNKDGALVCIYLPLTTLDIQEKEIKQLYALTVYPNPTQNELNIVTNNPEKVSFAKIITLDGKVISQFPLSLNEPNSVSIKSLQSGIYFVVYGSSIAKFQKL